MVLSRRRRVYGGGDRWRGGAGINLRSAETISDGRREVTQQPNGNCDSKHHMTMDTK